MPPLKRRTGFSLLELLMTIFAVILVLGVLIALLLPATRRSAGPYTRQTQCKNYLHQIGLALYNYHDDYDSFPPAITYDEDGQPLHSWRTLILPYVDQATLYESIDLSKPWNHPDNAVAAKTCPEVFRCPSADTPENCTTYLAIVSTTGCFHPTESRSVDDISDSTSNTLMVVEVSEADAVPWMAPQDSDGEWVLKFSSEKELPHTGGMHSLFADGSVRFLSANLSDAIRRAMLTIAGDDDGVISEF